MTIPVGGENENEKEWTDFRCVGRTKDRMKDFILYRHNQPGGHQSPQILPPPELASHHQNYRQPSGTSPVTTRIAVSLAARHQSPPKFLSGWGYVTGHCWNL